jgi:hypothetical protein
MKKFIISVIAAAAVMTPAFADQIYVNGAPFEGTSTVINGRTYVNIDSLSKALKLPHQHNVLNWQLSEKTVKGSPLQMSVDSNGKKLPTARFGGATMVDLISAANSLKLPVHRDLDAKSIAIGRPFIGQSAIGCKHK